MKTATLILLFFLLTSAAPAQNLTGFWKGNLTMGGGCFSVNNIELQLKIEGDTVSGDSYQYDNVNYYVKKSLTGMYDASRKRLVVHENFVTTFHIPQTCSICIKNFYLTYSRKGNVETLTGTWDGKIMNTNADCSIGPITLSRIRESAFKEVPEIIVDTGILRLDFYDNALVDGDSITVLVNKVVVLTHQRLTTKPITTFISIDLTHTFQEIEMVAENLGSIPPNTAMLIITAGSKKYQLFLSSTESKSAMVRFVYDKKKGP
ncbi:MAG: hypothetical protein ACJ75F_13200 [Flavisolibacter sp.]